MHPLRLWLYVSLAIGIAVAWGFGAALHHAGVAPPATFVLSVAVFLAFSLPWTGVFLWAVRRARDLDLLTDRAVRATEDPREVAGGGPYHAELDDLGRAVEELRATIVRQHRTLDEHRAAMAEVLASLGEGLLAIDGGRRVVLANSRFAEMFGCEGELTGRPLLEVLRRQTVVAALDRALEGESGVHRIDVGAPPHDRQIELRTVPVRSAEIAAVALFIDVTTLERLQQVRKEFLDDFSHEVRTPLAGLKSAGETLDRGGLTPAQELELRQIMQRQIARIERLVTDLSELNRIEAGELVLERRPVALRPLLLDLGAEFSGRTPAVRFSVEGPDVVVPADAARLQQIFSNLLDNAWKHGGGDVAVALAIDGGEAVVTISDHGPGLPPQDLERVFHRFYRSDRSRSTAGTGLGLAIVKHLTVLHGGSVRASNREGGGATFEVRLPRNLS